MDIHRCRFIPYPASPINALAFSHISKASQKTPRDLRLAVGRANGDIEIWNPAGGIWSQETVFRGGKNRSVEGLVWTQDLDEDNDNGTVPGRLRLFSIGYSSAVTEWNLHTGMPLQHSDGNHAEVWSLAVQPRWRKENGQKNKSEQLLAVGCADGSIVLHTTAEGTMEYVKALRRPSNSKARVLSLTFCDRNTIAAGCSDGTIWIYDVRSGKVKSTMHVGAGPTKSSTYVWTLRYLTDNTLVSGDSTGELKFWDMKTYTVTQRLICHDADILTLATNADGNVLLCGGMDRKISIITKDKSTRRWRAVYHQKGHAGHVKAMASIESKDLSVVVSGGIDAAPMVLPLRSSGVENVRTLSGLPQSPPLIGASQDRLLVSWWDREVAFCGLSKDFLQRVSRPESVKDLEEGDNLQRILLQGEENITSVTVSKDGRLLAVATNTSCKLFALSRRPEGGSTWKIRKAESASLTDHGARLVQFSPDGQWLLVVQPNNEIHLFEIQPSNTTKLGYEINEKFTTIPRSKQATVKHSPLGLYYQTISKVVWSADSKTIVCADLAGHIEAWTITGQATQLNGHVHGQAKTNGHADFRDDSSEESDESEVETTNDSSFVNRSSWRLVRSKLPKLSTSPLLLSFRSGADEGENTSRVSSDDRVVVVTLNHEVFEFHAHTGKLTDWSKRNPPSQFPRMFERIKDRTMGCVWDVSNNRQRLWLYGSTFLFMFDLNKDMGTGPSNDIAGSESKSLKRKRTGNSDKEQNRKRTAGAGDMSEYANDFGLIDRNVGFESDTDGMITEDNEDEDEEEDEEDAWNGFQDVNGRNGALLELRRQQNDPKENELSDADDSNKRDRQISWWFTHKYRSILGIVALDSERDTLVDEGDAKASDSKLLEVALVERPLWDLDLDLPFLS